MNFTKIDYQSTKKMRLILNFVVNICLLPLYMVFIVLASVFVWLPVYPNKVGVRNFQKRLNTGSLKARWYLFSVYLNYIAHFFEIFVLIPLKIQHIRNDIEVENFMDELNEIYGFEQKTGLMLMGAHFGNIEVAGNKIAEIFKKKYNKKFFVLSKPFSSKLLTRFLEKYRNFFGMQVIQTNRKDLSRAVLTTLKNGHGMGLISDQKPKTNGVFSSFFGEWAEFPVSGLDMALRAGVPGAFIVAKRISPGQFTFYFAHSTANSVAIGNSNLKLNRILFENKMQRTAESLRLMALYVGWLESCVEHNLFQWCWDYKKWSRKPTFGE